MENRAFEETGLVPRSIIRTFDRFRRQLLSGTERSMLVEFRASKFQVLVSVRCLIKLLLIPFLVNLLARNFVLLPATEYLWNTQQSEIFLNSYQEDRAFLEIKHFEDKMFFESLIYPPGRSQNKSPSLPDTPETHTTTHVNLDQPRNCLTPALQGERRAVTDKGPHRSKSSPQGFAEHFWGFQNNAAPALLCEGIPILDANRLKLNKGFQTQVVGWHGVGGNTLEGSETSFSQEPGNVLTLSLDQAQLSQKFQQKTIETAIYYNQQSVKGITNLFGDFTTLITIGFLSVWMKAEIIILKSFITESIYSFSDTTKSFLLILLTDLLVGFHSPRGWEIFIELVLRRFGLPEDEIFIFLFVATFPVLLDTVFKYWIFRYLNQISPSTVATYHTMIE